MTNVFAVVGEHRAQPSRLLLLGDDGHFYTFGTGESQPTEVRPTDEWRLDPDTTPATVDGPGVKHGYGF